MKNGGGMKGLDIARSAYDIFTSRSGGKGGQNVNKVETRVCVRFFVGASRFTDGQKRAICRYLAHRINERGELVLCAQEGRTQEENRRRVLAKLHELLREALKPRARRIATKPSRAVKERRLAEKMARSRKKQERRKKIDY